MRISQVQRAAFAALRAYELLVVCSATSGSGKQPWGVSGEYLSSPCAGFVQGSGDVIVVRYADDSVVKIDIRRKRPMAVFPSHL